MHFLLYTMVWHTSTLIDSDYYGFRNFGGKTDLICLYSISITAVLNSIRNIYIFPNFYSMKGHFQLYLL